jgi:Skp family chaperone for outer membrane proteins
MLYKKNSVVACVIAVFVSFFAVVPMSHAQAEGIVVVDIQQLEGMSVAGKSLKEKISSKRKALLAEVKKEEAALKSEQKKIAAAKATLSPEEFKAKAQAFEANFRDAQSKIVKKRNVFEKSAIEAHSKLRKEVVSVVGDMSAENKYKLVVSRQSVVIVEKSMDITAEAMKKLNAKVKSIPFK